MQLSHIWARIPPEIVCFPVGSGTAILVFKLVKDLGVQTDNMSTLSTALCTEAANKARRLIFMIRRFFHGLSKSAVVPIYGALVRPHLEYSLFAKPRCIYQPSRANSKISYKVGNWHASPPLKRETTATGPSFLAAATTSG